ncbi:MAG TPA: glycosyltransferase family 39 protein [Pirellulales bacterium]|jgi:4-amino-4-deoxy-L-arabinose transferase-like glycosyltransferase|nr:glycosyltransferase family 39 protein [Pirellulales bacterium]
MLKQTQYPLVLAAISATLFLANLGGAHLWDVDEAIFSQAANEMHERGDLVVPYFNGEVFPDKPPVMYWFMAAGYELFGRTELAARLFSAVFGIASVLVTYRLGTLLFSPLAGFWSGLALATTLNFNVIARAATPDAYLVFFVSLAILCFVSGTASARVRAGELNERNAPWAGQLRFEPSWRCYAATYAVMGAAVLTKGPVGVVLPTAILGLFLLVMRAEPVAPMAGVGWRACLQQGLRWMARVLAPRHVLTTIWSMRPLTALAAVLAVCGWWYIWVGVETNGEWLVGFFGVHNFGRFLNAMENHRGPIVYYVAAIAIGFFPWSVFAVPVVMNTRRQASSAHPLRASYVLVVSWIVVWVGFFSLAGTKLPSYVVPAYPALALATGALVARWIGEPGLIARLWTRLAWGTVGVVGVAMMVALPIVAHVYLDGGWALGLIGAIPLLLACVGWLASERGQVVGSSTALACLGAMLCLALFAGGAAYVDRFQDTPALGEQLAYAVPGSPSAPLASYRFFRPSLVFYSGRYVEKLSAPEDVAQFFDSHPGEAFLVTTDAELAKLRGQLPLDVSVLTSRRRFLRSGELVLLGRIGDSAMARSNKFEGERVH